MATLNPCRRRRYHPLFFLGPLLARRNGKEKASSHLRQWGRISEPTRSVGRHGGATEGRRGDGGVSTAAGRRHAKEGRRRRRRGEGARRRPGATARRRRRKGKEKKQPLFLKTFKPPLFIYFVFIY
ncbi:hypothetical protein LINPERHAP2_LOCUS10338 [Linum perenne]